MLAALTVAGLFIALAWIQQYFLTRLLDADLECYKPRPSPQIAPHTLEPIRRTQP
jgi:hypothetical protein